MKTRWVQGDACERHNTQRRFIFLLFPPLVCKWSHFQRGEFTWKKIIESGLTLSALNCKCSLRDFASLNTRHWKVHRKLQLAGSSLGRRILKVVSLWTRWSLLVSSLLHVAPLENSKYFWAHASPFTTKVCVSTFPTTCLQVVSFSAREVHLGGDY